MSEKLFELIEDDLEPLILDNKETMSVNEVADLLNEQQNTINKLKSDIEETEISIKLFEDDIATKDNKIDEQQATITALKEENEQLRQKLDFYLLDELEWKEKYGDLV